MSRKLRPLAALALVALIGAGCLNASSESDNTGTGTAGSTASKNSTHRDKAVKFAECMRDNGVSGFPDPDASGELTIDGVLNGSSLDSDSPAWKQAIGACEDLQPSGFTGHKRSAEQQEGALKFAQCIRDNGVKDFPDPAPDAPMVNTNRIPSAAREGGVAALNAAMRKCGDVIRDQVGRR